MHTRLVIYMYTILLLGVSIRTKGLAQVFPYPTGVGVENDIDIMSLEKTLLYQQYTNNNSTKRRSESESILRG